MVLMTIVQGMSYISFINMHPLSLNEVLIFISRPTLCCTYTISELSRTSLCKEPWLDQYLHVVNGQ